MKNRLNFSPRPFPASRGGAAALWLLNLALLAGLIASLVYWSALRRQNQSAHRQIDDLKTAQRDAAGQRESMIRELRALNLREYAQKVDQFHRIQAAYGTHWGRLLDDIGAALPDDVRVVSLRPVALRGNRAGGETPLQLSAEARVKQAQLDFIRALQDHGAFHGVRLEREEYDQTGVAVAFDLALAYRPGGG